MSITKLTSKKFDSIYESTVDPSTLDKSKFSVGDEIIYNNDRYIVTTSEIKKTSYAPPYKVYTALLTQALVSATVEAEGFFVVGNTYKLETLEVGDDFDNLKDGGVAQGDTFIYSSEAPTDWTNGSLVIDITASAPQATVLENTLGDITFNYNGIGTYDIKSDSLFVLDKTFFSTSSSNFGSDSVTVNIDYINADTISLYTFLSGVTWSNGNDSLYKTPIEIRVYN